MPRKKTETTENKSAPKKITKKTKTVKKKTPKAAKTKVKTTTKADNSSPNVSFVPLAIGLVVVIVIIVCAVVFIKIKGQKDLPEISTPEITAPDSVVEEDNSIIPTAIASEFAEYTEYKVNAKPNVKTYKIEDDFSNVTNFSDFTFSDEQQQKLLDNGFVVEPGYFKEFFQLYETNRYDLVPSFITTDSILHNYHLIFEYLLKQLEKQKLYDVLTDVTDDMFEESELVLEDLQGTDWENAAKRAVGFFNVAQILLDDNVEINEFLSNEVFEELELIKAASGISLSPLMNLGVEDQDIAKMYMEDYSQYIPRGHYNQSDELKAYFKTMMWYGRLNFRSISEDEIKTSILISYILNDNQDIFEQWESMYEPINFFVGKSDDITYYDYANIMQAVYGKKYDLEDLVDQNKLEKFIQELDKFEPPQINSIPIIDKGTNEEKKESVKGFRFLGQRFTVDAMIFQNLIYSSTGANSESENRMLPKALDIPAVFGSDKAYKILDNMGETEYEKYDENLTVMKNDFAKYDLTKWTQNLYWSWMYTLQPLLDVKSKGYPGFMTSDVWVNKDLNTFLSSWTELKHDTILYAKQVYAEMGGGPDEKKDDHGYVEPQPEVYSRLASLLDMTEKGLDSRKLMTKSSQTLIDKMKEMALTLKEIAEKELENKKLSDDDYEFIKYYGGELEHIWIDVYADEGIESASQIDEQPAALVADVATDPNGAVLEQATGKIFNIYSIVPVEDELRITKGGVFSHYEFTQPLNNRLTDEKWREMVNNGQEPMLADWVLEYVAQ